MYLCHKCRFLASNAVELQFEERERILAFADGVFSIAATLILLDLSIPPKLSDSQLKEYLRDIWPLYVSHVGAFSITMLLWHAHHNIFSHVRRCTQVFLFLHHFGLALVAFMPFASAINVFYGRTSESGALAIGFSAGTVTVAGSIQLVQWLYLCCAQQRKMLDESSRSSSVARHVAIRTAIMVRCETGHAVLDDH